MCFALNTLFDSVSIETFGPLRLQVPQLGSFDPLAAVVAAIAFVLLFTLRWSVLRTLGACAATGAVLYLITQ